MTSAQLVDAKWQAQAIRDALGTLICADGSHAVEIAAMTKAHDEFRKLAASLGYDVRPKVEDAA